MKLLFRILLVFIALSGLFMGCKKYPEDDTFMEFKKPEKRILGRWKIAKYEMNGADSTTFLFKQYLKDTSYYYGNLILSISTSGNGNYSLILNEIGGGDAKFVNKKNALYINFGLMFIGNNINTYNPFVSTTGSWTIRELTTSSLKIENNSNNIPYRIEFSKQ